MSATTKALLHPLGEEETLEEALERAMKALDRIEARLLALERKKEST